MQNLQTTEAMFQHFQVEELEERLENKWTNKEGYEDDSDSYDLRVNK